MADVMPDDPWTDEDRRNQAVVGNLNRAQFRYADEEGRDATNTLKGGAAWARMQLGALSSKMPPDDFSGVERYHISPGVDLNGRGSVVGLYHPGQRMISMGMAHPVTSPHPDVERDRRKAFTRAFTHEHGHHVDNMTNGGMRGETVGHLEARAENYADKYSAPTRTGYDLAAQRGLRQHFTNSVDPTGDMSMQDYSDVRASGDLPSEPRRDRNHQGRLQAPKPNMMPRRRVALYLG